MKQPFEHSDFRNKITCKERDKDPCFNMFEEGKQESLFDVDYEIPYFDVELSRDNSGNSQFNLPSFDLTTHETVKFEDII